LPIVVGGTHYYVQSLIWDTRQIPIETKLEAEKVENHPILSKVESMTNEELHSTLEAVDPEMASHWHPNDRRKIIRSLEVFYTTNKKQSDWFLEQEKGHDLEEITRFPTLLFWLFSDKKDLDKRLDDRVDEMVKVSKILLIVVVY
jgi:tRNA dimethylallyltransferase